MVQGLKNAISRCRTWQNQLPWFFQERRLKVWRLRSWNSRLSAAACCACCVKLSHSSHIFEPDRNNAFHASVERATIEGKELSMLADRFKWKDAVGIPVT
jgi:hypothetical protein